LQIKQKEYGVISIKSLKSNKLTVQEICSIGLFVAIIAVCAQISFPIFPNGVPMTLQTFAIPLAGVVLGAKNGMIAALVYVLLGMVGVPVFAGFTGGIGIVFGRTGGFILAFPFMAFAAGIGAKKDNLAWLVLWLTIGAVVLYTVGMLVFSLVAPAALWASFTLVVVPFLPTEVIKIVLVILFGKLINKALKFRGMS